MAKIKILYAEDDATLAFLTKDNLEQNGYEVCHCNNGQMALEAFRNQKFDTCIFDILMPKLDGFELATEIRKSNQNIPILFLSAKTLKEDKLKGLRLGADDYLIKPFSIEELILKIEVFAKRSQVSVLNKISKIQIGKYIFDPNNLNLIVQKSIITLTQRENDLLLLLYQNKNQILKREVILEKLWGNNDYFLGRSLDVFVSRLRKILSQDTSIQIENLHGIGFRFIVEN